MTASKRQIPRPILPRPQAPYESYEAQLNMALQRELFKLQVHIDEASYGWDDLRFPAQSINPAGTTEPAALDTTETGFPGTLLFSGSKDCLIAGVAQIPHAWLRGSYMVPHIHWSKPTPSSLTVSWEFYVRFLGNVGDAATAWDGPRGGVLVAGNQGAADAHLLTTFGTLTMTNVYQESFMLSWRIYRRGTTDADNSDVRLYEFDIHYQRGKAGTVDQLPEA